MCLLSHFLSETTEAIVVQLCMGLQPYVNEVLKHFGVVTITQQGCRAQKLVKLVPVPMSDKMSLCPTNCPYVRQKCPHVRQKMWQKSHLDNIITICAHGCHQNTMVILMPPERAQMVIS